MFCTGPSDVVRFVTSEKSVETWMHRGVVSCSPETPVEEVAKTMDSEDISALVVTDEGGDAIGVISRTDLVNARFVQPYMKHWRGMTALHLMSQPVVSVPPDASIAALMFSHTCRVCSSISPMPAIEPSGRRAVMPETNTRRPWACVTVA